jgi:hypothetical protein
MFTQLSEMRLLRRSLVGCSILKALSIASCVGMLLSFASSVYSARQYFSSSLSQKTLQILLEEQDVIAPKVEALLSSDPKKEIVLRVLKASQRESLSAKTKLSEVIVASRRSSGLETIMWIIVSGIFGGILVRLEKLRHRS